jgi:3-(3-hydroxy-phenyl)propionate hydroxylase
MAPPNAGFRLMREAALRLSLDDDAVRALINPRQSTPVAYVGSPLNVGAGSLVGRPAPDARLDAGIDGGASHLSMMFGRRPVLLRFGDEAPADIDGVDTMRLPRGAHAEAWVRYHAIDGGTVLVRPDGYVAAEWPAFDARAIRGALATMHAKEAADVPR